ncbi:hypothetical protein [Micromonospora aurantiaca (nom. illeg.)]|uniref:hypothetical protein n=1 Tax=Micromonospora aurantiaca (nom. illeg.) TaxID=47850 RepID=UPI00340C20BD
MTNIGDGRPLRVCDLCGIVDDHPRHSIVGAVPGQELVAAPTDQVIERVTASAPTSERARLLRELLDTSTSDRHLDCCREQGCPLPADDPNNCGNRTRGAESKRGGQLLAYLTGGA